MRLPPCHYPPTRIVFVALSVLFGAFAASSCNLSTGNQATVSPGEKDRIEIAQRFTKDFIAGRFQNTYVSMNEQLRAALTESKSKKVVDTLMHKIGKVQQFGQPVSKRLAGFEVVYTPCIFDHGQLVSKVVFDTSNKVAGFFFVRPGAD